MTIYIALLRGINLGGKNIIKMAELKRVFEAMGLYDVKTYIQSGNVLFKSNDVEEVLQKRVEHEIQRNFGFPVPVILRTVSELEYIIENCPFTQEEIFKAESSSKVECLYVALLANSPSQDKIQLLNTYKSESEKYIIEGRDIFFLFHNSIRNSKLANNLQKLEVPVTTRNWKTLSKLNNLAKAMKE